MPMVDFQQVKASNQIADVARQLGLELIKSSSGYRCKCPTCESTGDRNISITPDKNLWFCFTLGKGGDVLALVSHVKGISVREAAEFLAGKPAGNTSKEKVKEETPSAGFIPLDYLVHDHEAVAALGITPEDAKRIGCGYAPRGSMKQTVMFPLRDTKGKLLGYLGTTDCMVPKSWRF